MTPATPVPPGLVGAVTSCPALVESHTTTAPSFSPDELHSTCLVSPPNRVDDNPINVVGIVSSKMKKGARMDALFETALALCAAA